MLLLQPGHVLVTLISGLGFTRAAEYFYDVIPNRFSDEESAID